ncbi:nicotinamide riboside transporter PnuC [Pseudarthrobacter sp. J75]|uniref:nicotinamide riboside transporter PnuC n=1 Tax=unclassified Pseudarthrobacter TaxID=2647000 RepID=UPI002E818E34|nr:MULTISPECIES: nicotinamide riboside transporter PnuC [unclassified Pseudarthrobacter]MEE2522662.1 nicotinamide riboside transporter PnuC [Pseudarthrobacter sp. J47]MEE2529523.1 nicotinamide riboside transporter PnuC [Pseudarthrobacter sp. J75]MEE2569709.1 nicotinamide riboside transporter PnuC [Pseudarthrobacter sp. J64]
MDLLRWLFEAQIPVGGSVLILREVLGNIFGLASALGGMRRKVWAWPVGIAGNLLLLTVFLGNVFGSATPATLWGQASRQVMFIAVAAYGWHRWQESRRHSGAATAAGAAITPGWAGTRTRIILVAAMVAGTAALTPLFDALGSYPPVWADAWTFMGSLLATYGMARGWTEFWLIWVAVDIVGVPLLFSAGYYASALMYLFYGFFTLAGFFVWWRASRKAAAASTVASGAAAPSAAGVPGPLDRVAP